jgi:hypothetical protein
MYSNVAQTTNQPVRDVSPLQRARDAADGVTKNVTELHDRLRMVRDRVLGSRPEKDSGSVGPAAPYAGFLSEAEARFQGVGGWLSACHQVVNEILSATEGE